MKNVRNIWKLLIASSLISCNSFKHKFPALEQCLVGLDSCVCIKTYPSSYAKENLIEENPELIAEFNSAMESSRRTQKAISFSRAYCENYVATNIDDFNEGKSWIDQRLLDLKYCEKQTWDW